MMCGAIDYLRSDLRTATSFNVLLEFHCDFGWNQVKYKNNDQQTYF